MPLIRFLSSLGRRRRPDSCLLFLTHRWNDGIAAAFATLAASVGSRFDLHVLVDETAESGVPELAGVHVHRFTADMVTPGAYPAKAAHHPGTVWPMNIDLPVLWFFRAHPGYRWYWAMEYDVRFTGDWTRFFEAFADNDAALLCSTVYRHAFRPGWGHWGTLTGPVAVPEAERIRGLFPLYRLSNAALVSLDAAYRVGWGGHYEVAIPSIMARDGLRIEDFGGDGAFVAPGNRNRFYRNTPANPGLRPGSFCVAPNSIDPACPDALLWHPIKN